MDCPQRGAPRPGEWIAGHLHHHEDLDLVVLGFVQPLVASLVRAASIDAFFFVRDGLGGPHVRLRLRLAAGERDTVQAAMRHAALAFLERRPSSRSLSEEAIRRSNERILAADPHEIDGAVYPDNSFRVVQFRPEVQRYGGPERLAASLDLFVLSSVAAVHFVRQLRGKPRSIQLAHAFELLLNQALCFAAEPAELADLLRYGVDSWGAMLPAAVDKGDRAAPSHMPLFLHLFGQAAAGRRSLDADDHVPASAKDHLAAGALHLSAAIRGADRATRAGIGGSHLHMTASRLGLTTPEEVYVSRLLTATYAEARTAEKGVLAGLLAPPRGGPARLSGLLPSALAWLAQLPIDEPVGGRPA